MKKSGLLLAASLMLGSTLAANASPFTITSPNGALPGGVTQVGGLVLDLKGTNGNRVVAQVAASSLFSASPARVRPRPSGATP